MAARLGSSTVRVGPMDLHVAHSIDPPRYQAPHVVLVHGLGVSARHMAPAAEAIGGTFPVVIPDLPGTGRSAKPWRVLGVADLASTLVEVMDELEIPEAVFGSISFGCQVVIDVAYRFPERVLGSVLVGPTIDGAARNMPMQILRLLLDGPREPLSLMPVVARDYLDFGVRRGAITLAHALGDDVLAKLPAISSPVVVVRGEHDPLVPRAWTDAIVDALPDASFVEIPGAAHAANFSHPRHFARLIEELAGRVAEDY